MANRGALGGLSEAALQAALLLDAAGRQDVFVETVGVGQAEIDIIDHADTIVLVLMPGSGDSIQALKAGRDGDPGRDRDQQGRPSADRHDDPRDPRRALARQPRPHARGGARALAGADRQDRGHPRRGHRRARREPRGAPRPHPRRRTARRAARAQPAQRGAGDRDRAHAPAPGGGPARGRRVPAPARGGRRSGGSTRRARPRPCSSGRRSSSVSSTSRRLGAMDSLDWVERSWPLLRPADAGPRGDLPREPRPDRPPLPGRAADAAARSRRRQERAQAHEPARCTRRTARTSCSWPPRAAIRRTPAWFHNLLANPDTTVQVGSGASQRARPRGRRRRSASACGRWWCTTYGGYDDYQQRTEREIPLVVLEPR